jgi:hypothetical protein
MSLEDHKKGAREKAHLLPFMLIDRISFLLTSWLLTAAH